MRRTITTVITLVAAFTGVACEDGPSQTFESAPSNAGNLWNNGDSPAVVNQADASLQATFSGASKTQICAGPELQSQWARMVEQPIVPPYKVAGIDISGTDYETITVNQAQSGPLTAFTVLGSKNPPTRLCQANSLGQGSDSGEVIGGTLQVGWGQNNEFQMEYAINTLKDYYNSINPGYVGSMSWTYTQPAATTPPTNGCTATTGCDGKKHTYQWQLGQPILDNGQVFALTWNGYGTPTQTFYQQADVLYRGITSFFVPDLFDNLPPGILCNTTGRCPAFPTGNDGVHPIIGFRTISMYWNMDPPVLPEPSGSTPYSAYFFNIKYAPYSPAISLLDMSTATGPTGSLNPIGDLTPAKDCELALGGTFGTLSSNCINVFADTATDSLATAKVLGNLSHDDQNFTFSVVGINQNYRPPQLDIGGSRQFDIIHDGEQPAADAVAVDFTLDVRANGPILNDRYATTTPGVYGRDNHGSGAVWREYGRLVHDDLEAKYVAQHPGFTALKLHDPSCLFAANQDPTKFVAAPGCTGFEAWVDDAYPNVYGTTGEPVSATDPTATDPDNVWDVNNLGAGVGILGYFVPDDGLRPGTPYSVFCMDPGTYDFCGSPALFGQANDLISASLAQVTQIMGNGNIANLPPGVGDRRYFWQFFTQAFAKYLASGAALHAGNCGGTYGADPANGCGAVAATNTFDPVPYFHDFPINQDDFFYDSIGGLGARSEFVQYQFADLTHDPMGLNLEVLLLSTNWQETHIYRRLDREERALFEAMGSQDSKAAGQAAWALAKDGSGNVINDEFGVPRKNADVFITNLAGSTAIAAAITPDFTPVWSAPADAMGNPIPVGTADAYDPCFPTLPPAMVMKTAYYCATHLDSDCVTAASDQAPTNDDGTIITRANGEPLLSGYCGIWNPTQFALGSQNLELTNADLTPQQQEDEEEAEVIVPNYANPYDPTTTNTPIKVLVPYLPSLNGIGFSVPDTGDTSVFVQTAQLDFSGQVIVPVFDFLPVSVPTTNADGGLTGGSQTFASIQAIESGDFLGDVFLCYDAVSGANRNGSGRPGDILAAHMYTSVVDILNWIETHPQAQANCSIIVTYSPFDNYPDYITSLTNGVTVAIDQGAGYGRVVDLTLFVPGSGAMAQP